MQPHSSGKTECSIFPSTTLHMLHETKHISSCTRARYFWHGLCAIVEVSCCLPAMAMQCKAFASWSSSSSLREVDQAQAADSPLGSLRPFHTRYGGLMACACSLQPMTVQPPQQFGVLPAPQPPTHLAGRPAGVSPPFQNGTSKTLHGSMVHSLVGTLHWSVTRHCFV